MKIINNKGPYAVEDKCKKSFFRPQCKQQNNEYMLSLLILLTIQVEKDHFLHSSIKMSTGKITI